MRYSFAQLLTWGLACAAVTYLFVRRRGAGASAREYHSHPAHGQIATMLRGHAATGFGATTGRRVLLTGAAGFVGFHTSLELHRLGHAVVGVDNFNHYYDVRLKRKRHEIQRETAKTGPMLEVVEGDVCDSDLLKLLLREGKVTNVIHLAAQAGVRYSLKNPLAYVEVRARAPRPPRLHAAIRARSA